MKKILLSIMLISIGVSSQLKNAKVGEYYEVSGNALALLREPKVSVDANVNKENIIVDLTDDEKNNIQIIDTKGFIDRFYKVNLIRDGKIKLTGWIWSKAVTNSKKISKKDAYYYEKPKIFYEPKKDDIESEIQKLDKKEVLVGQWIDESPYAFGIVTIIKRGSKTIIKEKIKNYESEKVGRVVKQGQSSKISYDNNSGEYYILDSNGNLSIYDNQGLITKYKKIK